MPEEETEAEPKHPYVTRANGKVHFYCSIAMAIASIIQLIIGIVLSEKQVAEIQYEMEGKGFSNQFNYRYNRIDQFDEWYHGDNVWIAFVGFVLAALGLSVWHTRSRANGIILSVMLFIAGFCIYPIAAGLGGAMMAVQSYESPYFYGIKDLRAGSGVFIGVQALFIICWAFYTAFHSCCNSKVRRQTTLNMPGGGGAVLQPQQQMVFVQQPGQQVMTGGQQVMMMPAGGQPVMMAGGQQVMMAGGQQVMMPGGQIVMAGGPQMMMPAGQQPVYVVQGPPPPGPQIPAQPQQVQLPGYADDYSPPSYSES